MESEKKYIPEREDDESWVDEGGLPPNEFESKMIRLEEDVINGNVPESERRRIAQNAKYAFLNGYISKHVYNMLMRAVRVDDCGNLMDNNGC